MSNVVQLKDKKCFSCKLWEQPDPDTMVGYCHRFPPVMGAGDNGESGFIVTVGADWCGEHTS